MRTIRNATTRPVKVPLPRGKVLHLGPLHEGQISHNDVDHEPLQALIKDGTIEIGEGPEGSQREATEGSAPHEMTTPHHPDVGPQTRGNR